jgi:hypothetical protein
MTTLRALVGAYSLSGGFIARGQQQVWTRHCPCCGRWLAKLFLRMGERIRAQSPTREAHHESCSPQ